jgi:hypothetical protein
VIYVVMSLFASLVALDTLTIFFLRTDIARFPAEVSVRTRRFARAEMARTFLKLAAWAALLVHDQAAFSVMDRCS